MFASTRAALSGIGWCAMPERPGDFRYDLWSQDTWVTPAEQAYIQDALRDQLDRQMPESAREALRVRLERGKRWMEREDAA